jgi:hypothetical protein
MKKFIFYSHEIKVTQLLLYSYNWRLLFNLRTGQLLVENMFKSCLSCHQQLPLRGQQWCLVNWHK